jgi:hypothetical protein
VHAEGHQRQRDRRKTEIGELPAAEQRHHQAGHAAHEARQQEAAQGERQARHPQQRPKQLRLLERHALRIGQGGHGGGDQPHADRQAQRARDPAAAWMRIRRHR